MKQLDRCAECGSAVEDGRILGRSTNKLVWGNMSELFRDFIVDGSLVVLCENCFKKELKQIYEMINAEEVHA